jgi:hypothetical protein
MSQLDCEWQLEDFTASAFYTGESPRMVSIEGKGTCPQTGYAAELVVVEGASEPDKLHVKIVEQAPDFGANARTPTETAAFLYQSQATEVVIDGLGSLHVAEPTDP